MTIDATEYALVDPTTLKPAPYNPRRMSARNLDRLADGIKEFGLVQPIVVNTRSGYIVGGHQRVQAAIKLGLGEVPVVYINVDDERERALNIRLNNPNVAGEYDLDKLKDLLEELDTGDFDLNLTGYDDGEIERLLTAAPPPPEDPTSRGGGDDNGPTEPDDKPAITRVGDLIVMGPHLLLCGDSTSPADVARLMADHRATLVQADPPYGMGKEADGVANDNLTGPRLDAFQLAWWKAWRPCIVDNASAYVWGKAEDLWRWWYTQLAATERMSVRTEIVWRKGDSGPGQKDGVSRQFTPLTERCLFIMLGEQDISPNADGYWDGWEPIRSYLAGEFDKMAWTRKDIKKLCGVSESMASHWFGRSQWHLITEAHYTTLQAVADGNAFTRPYAELAAEYESIRKAFEAGRPYFDNTHDAMGDVWDFPRVAGEDRQGHPTPKPVAMIERILWSSTRQGDVVAVPFGGSGPDLIACQNTGRIARVMEVDPKWCDVIVARWEAFTGQTAQRLGRDDLKGERTVAEPRAPQGKGAGKGGARKK